MRHLYLVVLLALLALLAGCNKDTGKAIQAQKRFTLVVTLSP